MYVKTKITDFVKKCFGIFHPIPYFFLGTGYGTLGSKKSGTGTTTLVWRRSYDRGNHPSIFKDIRYAKREIFLWLYRSVPAYNRGFHPFFFFKLICQKLHFILYFFLTLFLIYLNDVKVFENSKVFFKKWII